jgi:hypothetical protein
MLKRVMTIAATVAFAAAALGAQGARPESLAARLPARAVALLQAEDLPALGRAFEGSALAAAMQKSQVLRYLRTVAGAGWDFGAVLLTGLPAEEARDVLDGRVGLALLELKPPAAMREQPPMVLLIEAGDPKRLHEILESQLDLFGLLQKELRVEQREQQGATVVEVTPPNGKPFAYTFQDGVLVLGGTSVMRTYLESVTADGPRLASDAAFQAVAKQLPLPNGGLRAYLNVEAVMQQAALAARPEALRRLKAMGLGDAKGAGAAIDFVEGQVRDRIYLHTGAPASGMMRFLTDGQPIAPTAAQFVPPSYTVVGTMALTDVGLWDRMHQALVDFRGEAAANNMQAGANMVLQNFGIQIKEGFFDTFTDELFFALDLSKLGSFAGVGREPAPQEIPFIFGARLKDANALLDTFNRIAANERLFEQGIERTIAKHREVDVATFAIPGNAEVQPTYAVVDDVLLFSIRRDSVVKAIDAYKTKESLGTTLLGKEGDAFPAKCHGRMDLADAQFLGSLVEMIQVEAPDDIRPYLPEMTEIVKGLSGYHGVLRREKQGYSLTAVSDLGTVGTGLVAVACVDQFNRILAQRVAADFEKFAGALAEYREKHGAYPETLEQLVPDYLPNVVQDRFEPKRAYRYSRGQPGPNGEFPDAWVIASVGPDKTPDVPVEQFDPAAWTELMATDDPEQVERLKRLIYQFRKSELPDERKNDDEGDLVRLGGRGLDKPRPKPPAKAAPEPPAAAEDRKDRAKKAPPPKPPKPPKGGQF